MEYDVFRKMVAEFIGTFALVTIGLGSIVVFSGEGVGGTVGVALAFGLTLAVMISSLGHVSGGHFNPAVTLGTLLTGRIGLVGAGTYWLAQLAGAAAGAAVIRLVYEDNVADNSPGYAWAPALNPAFESWEGVVFEALMTFFLVWVVFATAIDKRGAWPAIAGLGIGLMLVADILFGGPLTGAAVNPAVAFGPQVVFNDWSDFSWIYYVGPLAGGAIAALLYALLYLGRQDARAA